MTKTKRSSNKREEARQRADAWLREGNLPGMRSCWSCNAGHEGLKDASYVFLCFNCGHWFFDGEDITSHLHQ